MIPIKTRSWSSVIAFLINNRIEYHTSNADPDVIHTSSHSDNGADAKCAG